MTANARTIPSLQACPGHFPLLPSLAKNVIEFAFGEARFSAIFSDSPARPDWILFGQEGIIILRGGGRGEPYQRLAVIPGHPFRWITLQLLGVPLQLGQIIERIGSVQLAGVDQTHEQIADSGAVHRLVEERVLAVQNRLL